MSRKHIAFRSKVFGVFVMVTEAFPDNPVAGTEFTCPVGDGQAEPRDVRFVYNDVWHLVE